MNVSDGEEKVEYKRDVIQVITGRKLIIDLVGLRKEQGGSFSLHGYYYFCSVTL